MSRERTLNFVESFSWEEKDESVTSVEVCLFEWWYIKKFCFSCGDTANNSDHLLSYSTNLPFITFWKLPLYFLLCFSALKTMLERYHCPCSLSVCRNDFIPPVKGRVGTPKISFGSKNSHLLFFTVFIFSFCWYENIIRNVITFWKYLKNSKGVSGLTFIWVNAKKKKTKQGRQKLHFDQTVMDARYMGMPKMLE